VVNGPKPEDSPPIQLDWKVPAASVSGLAVASLQLTNERYRPYKGEAWTQSDQTRVHDLDHRTFMSCDMICWPIPLFSSLARDTGPTRVKRAPNPTRMHDPYITTLHVLAHQRDGIRGRSSINSPTPSESSSPSPPVVTHHQRSASRLPLPPSPIVPNPPAPPPARCPDHHQVGPLPGPHGLRDSVPSPHGGGIGATATRAPLDRLGSPTVARTVVSPASDLHACSLRGGSNPGGMR
jgi:hypothetical protein